MKTDLLRQVAGVFLLGTMTWVIFVSITGWSHARYEAQLEDLTVSRASLVALVQRMSELPEDLAKGRSIPETLLWPGSDQGSDLQREIVDLANETGITLTSYGGSVGPTDLEIPTVAFEIEAQSDYSALTRFLAGLERLQPRVSVGSLWLNRLQPSPERPDSARVTLRLAVWGFLALQDGAP
ncbi:GspMb/PilO family protein [Stagnihabitans tardus]|uniref:General secretion pathway protein GspM n=1 Tax=Stagnihabitans tardus TaxID=2699202 RepID=A0AAE4YCE4_9RHOB|nr:GspMb/PilO family protein [Stagnihabitans tardus]NBZ90076.1 hypothetical protein [Stagnihabitans tardus]